MPLEVATKKQKESVKKVLDLNIEGLIMDYEVNPSLDMILSDNAKDSENAIKWVNGYYNDTRRKHV